MKIRMILALCAPFAAVFVLQPLASAKTFTCRVVVNQTNKRFGSLQLAVNAAPSGGTLSLFGTCGGTTVINKSVSILGVKIKRSGTPTLNGHGLGSVLRVGTAGSVTINNLTITNGSGSGTALIGGGILNFGTLTITSSTISGNTAGQGGGIYNDATLAVTDSTFSTNAASSGLGGGIYNAGTAMLTNSTFSGNTASSGGGGGYNSGTLTLSNSTFSSNMASTGGGIYNESTGTVTLSGTSSISGNTATAGLGFGGGIFNNGGTLNGATAGVNVLDNTPDNIAP